MSKHKIYFSLMVVCFVLLSCKKDDKIEKTETILPEISKSKVVFNFKGLADNQPLIKDTKWYANAFGDSFTVNLFNYYISNLRFKKDDGSYFYEPESYHLIQHVKGSTTFTINNFPVGNYTELEFLIGVDSLRNVSGAQTGDLSPDSIMFWEWNSGYIFFKLEGQYKTMLSPIPNNFAMHIGGFKGKYKSIQKCSFNQGFNLITSKDNTSRVFFNTSINEIFINPLIIDFDTYSVIGIDQKSKNISENYKDMFSLDRIDN